MNDNHTKRLGDQNGWTVAVFKVSLIAAPIVLSAILSLVVWIVTSLNALDSKFSLLHQQVEALAAEGPRYSRGDARADQLELREALVNKITEGPRWLRDMLTQHSERIARIEKQSHTHGPAD